MKKVLKRVLTSALVLGMVVSSITPTHATEAITLSSVSSKAVPVPSDRIYITSQTYNLVPGATETVITTNNETGTDQRIGFVMKVDGEAIKNGTIKPVATYKDYQYETYGMQTVTDQAAAYEEHHEGETIFAGINADFYDLNSGKVTGIVVMDGVLYQKSRGYPFLAVLKDGTVVIRNGNQTDYSDIQDAVGGNMQIITNGQITVEEGDYQVLKYSRTGVGITADGSIVTYVTHGISKPTSCGETYTDVAKVLLAQGCVNAIMLDGGGSATYASMREGTEELKVVNNPSDGTPRTVANALCFASTIVSDGEFHHASLTPNNQYYTPTTDTSNPTTVQLKAEGIDASGKACELPEGLKWAVSAESAKMGTIDADTGLFTAAKNAFGVVEINLLKGDDVVGTTTIGLAEPDEILFSGSGVSLNFGDVTDLGFTVKSAGIVLNVKDGDFDWKVKSINSSVNDSLIGTVTNNTFTAGAKQAFALEGNVSVSYKKLDGTTVSSKILVEIGKMPIVALDFENVDTNIRGKDVVGSWDWGAKANNFNDANATDQVYKFQNYQTLYYLQSTTYGSDSQWIKEVYTTTQPWIENEDGATVTLSYKGDTVIGTKEATYGVHGEKWVSFTHDGAGYYYRGFMDGDTWTGGYNAGGGAAATFLGADGYQIYAWHNTANLTNLASGRYKGIGSKIVDSSEGEVRFGKYALKLTYDFENFNPVGGSKNTSIYYRMTDEIVAQGSPTGFGMWLYAPEGMDNFWLWGQISYWNGTQWTSSTIHYKPTGASKTCQFTGVNWTGWQYVEMDLSAIYDAGAKVDAEHPIRFRSGTAPIQLTYIPGGSSDGEGHAIVMGSKTSGHFYVDNMRWVYGSNIDDMNNPEIISAKANDDVLSTDKVTTLDTNDIEFVIDFTDPQGENYSGIDTTATQLFLDGSPLSASDFTATADKAQTGKLKLANGEHALKVSICDNFGNRTEKTYSFVIANPNSDIPSVTISREESAELGGDYNFVIKTDHLSDIASVTTNITYHNISVLETSKSLGNGFFDDYGNLLTQGPDGLYYDANGEHIEEPLRGPLQVYISNATQKLGPNLTGKLRNKATQTSRTFTATATVKDTVTNDNTLLNFTLPIPKDLAEKEKIAYSVTVTYTTKSGETYTVTTGDQVAKVYAYYTIVPGIQVSGAATGDLEIVTKDGATLNSETTKVYTGSILIDGTYEGNTFTTNYFVTKEASSKFTDIVVADDVNKHYSYKTTVTVADAAVNKEDYLHYDVTLNAVTDDITTKQHITWLSAYNTDGKAVVQYMPKADYVSVEGTEDPFANATVVEGKAKLTYFATEGIAAYINNAQISGLTPNTTYVVRVGDGNTWSKVYEFKTMNNDGDTKFMVMADVQLGSSMSEEDKQYIENIANLNTNIDFGVQTGDFTDNPDSFVEWDNILDTWGQVFKGKNFVHTIGNHEVYGTGANNSVGLLGLSQSQKDYYSVEIGDVYVAVINQTADLNTAAKWLVEDAAKTNCTWKVLTSHQPIYYTNPNGSSQGHNKVLAPACDAAGIDFTFSGHDHAYARTLQQFANKALDYAIDNKTNAYVDAAGNKVATQGQGTVYYICGDLGEKSRESGYKAVNNPAFNFAVVNQDYDALYLEANANKYSMTINTWSVALNGEKTLIDTFTMYNAEGICNLEETHVLTQDTVKYNSESHMLICDRCGHEVDPTVVKYTGYAEDMNGKDEYGDYQYYFLAGNVRTGFFTWGDIFLYANEDGLIDHLTENKDTNTCTENGNKTAYSPRYDEKYTGGKVPFSGHEYTKQEDGSLVCDTCGHKAIDVADWDFSLSYTSTNYNGTKKYPAINITNPETGEKLTFATDGMGKLTDYARVWYNNQNVGIATVDIIINERGNYTNSKGTVTLQLRINPNVPTNVTANTVDATTVQLSWDAATQATAYKVYKVVNGKYSLVATTNETSITLTDLNSSSTYQYAVKSVATIGDLTLQSSGYSNIATVETNNGIDLKDAEVTLSYTKTTYNGNTKLPTPTVKINGVTLVAGVDYVVTRADNVNAGEATVTVTGKGKYTGKATVTFIIAPQSISKTATKATVKAEDITFSDNNVTKVVVTNAKGEVLVEGVDYTVEFTNNTSVGKATVKVTGIGNYTGTIKGNYTITSGSISSLKGSVDKNADLTFTGSAVEPKINIHGLVLGTDYTVTYTNNVKVGKATATVTGIGNYKDQLTVEFDITPKAIDEFTVTDSVIYTYTGEAIEAVVDVVSDTKALLVKDVDYKLTTYTNNVNIGTATVVVEGIGNYAGTITHEFTIVSKDVKGFNVTINPESYVYSGKTYKPSVTVTNDSNVKLVAGVDYVLEYTNNKNAGTATVTVTGKGNYAGTITRNFTIEHAKIENTKVTLKYDETTFTGGYKKPGVVVKTANGTTLKAGTNYTVTYKNNKKAGEATVVITGINNYAGTKEIPFTINAADINERCTITFADGTYYADGTEHKPAVQVVTKNGTVLKEGTNYEVVYTNNVKAGTATVTVNGKGNYTGTATHTFVIRKTSDIAKLNVSLSYTTGNYTGSEKTPKVTVTTAKGTKLAKDKNYTVEYVNNVEVGEATVIIKGIGKYSGTVTKTFKIRPAKVTNVQVAQSTKTTLKVSFTRDNISDKYYIYADGKYMGCTVTKDYYTIKGLKSNTSYKITVKAVKEVNGVNYYSSASKAITGTTK